MGYEEKLGNKVALVRHKAANALKKAAVGGKATVETLQQVVETGEIKAAVELSSNFAALEQQESAAKHEERRKRFTKLLVEAELALPELRRTVLDGFDPTVQRVDACIAAIMAMDELDFVNQTYGGYAEVKACRVKLEAVRDGGLLSGGVVPSHAEVVEVMTALDTGIPAGRGLLDAAGDDGKVPWAELKEFSTQLDHAFKSGMEYGRYAGALHAAVDAAGPAIEAYLMNVARLARQNQIPDKHRARLETGMQVFNGLVGIASHFVPPTYNAIPGAVKALSTAIENLADDMLLADAAEKARKGAAPGTEFEVLKPLDIADWLYAGHMKNARLGIRMIGIAGEEIPGWSIISMAILKIIEAVLARKITEAEKKLPEAELKLRQAEKGLSDADLMKKQNQSVPDLIFGSLQKEILDELKPASLLGTILEINDGEFDPIEWAENKALETILDVLAPKIAEWFPPEPAQAVDGDGLRAYARAVLVSNHPKWVGGGEAAEIDAFPLQPAEGAPGEDKYGRKVEASDGLKTKHNADGSVRYYVAVKASEKLVWGFINPQTLAFLVDYPDNSALSDWKNRFIDRDSYRENGQLHSGKWYKPVESQNFYLFVGDDGSHEWAGGQASTANTSTGNVMGILEHIYQGNLNPSTDVLMELNAV